jgi:hypothetical protein
MRTFAFAAISRISSFEPKPSIVTSSIFLPSIDRSVCSASEPEMA